MNILHWFRDFFGKDDVAVLTQKLSEEKIKLDIEDFAIQMAVNMIAGAIGKCTFRTYLSGKEVKGDEFYLWNIQPNSNQSSSEFLQEMIAKMLMGECLVVPAAGQLIIADSFSRQEYVLYEDLFSNVTRGSFTFSETFSMSDVLYFRLGDQRIHALLSRLMGGYAALVEMAESKYRRSGGRKGKVTLEKPKSGDEDTDKRIKEMFNADLRTYYESENAAFYCPKGVDYEELSMEGSKRSTSEVADITALTREAFSRVAQAFRIPPALLQGDTANIETPTENLLTFCVDVWADLIQSEITRKRFGKEAFLNGSFLKVDTSCIRHIDLFSVADKADKLISSSLYNVDELRQKLGDMPLHTHWSGLYWMTRNYMEVTSQTREEVKSKTMEILKSGTVADTALNDAELEQINRYTLEPLTAEEVFTFRVVVCGNEIDRDQEAFTTEALQKLADMLVGRTVIQNHDHRAENQLARIYRTEVTAADGVSKTGESKAVLNAFCYMVRTESNKDFITELRAGIKKEVSIGCAVEKAVCSICGKTACGHTGGKEYGGKLCYRSLENPSDAYEVSFVPVPAQPEAGVSKSYSKKNTVAACFAAAFKRKEDVN